MQILQPFAEEVQLAELFQGTRAAVNELNCVKISERERERLAQAWLLLQAHEAHGRLWSRGGAFAPWRRLKHQAGKMLPPVACCGFGALTRRISTQPFPACAQQAPSSPARVQHVLWVVAPAHRQVGYLILLCSPRCFVMEASSDAMGLSTLDWIFLP